MQDVFLVSIPVITYNHKNFIKQNLDGILMQKTDFRYEIIIGEDCSTDGTREIIFDYAKRFPKMIKVITSDTNVGSLNNQIRTLVACSGKYFAFCEGDDYWTDIFKLQKQIDFLEQNQDYGMVHTDADYYYQKGNRLVNNFNKSNKINFPSGKIFNELLNNFLFIVTATVCVQKEIFLEAFNPELFASKNWLLNDLPLWLEIAAKTKIKYFGESTAAYRLSNDSASRSNDLVKHHKFHLSVFDIRYYYWKKYSKDEAIKKKLDIAYYDMIIGDAYKMKDLRLVRNAMEEMKQKNIQVSLKQWFKYFLVFLIGFLKFR